MSTIRTSGLLILLTAGAVGCAEAIPPPELVTARADYSRASQGNAGKLDPADLHTADVSLSLAEQSFTKDGDTQDTRDLAYVADRRAQIAEARGDAMLAAQQ